MVASKTATQSYIGKARASTFGKAESDGMRLRARYRSGKRERQLAREQGEERPPIRVDQSSSKQIAIMNQEKCGMV
jgi:hypothetical protein